MAAILIGAIPFQFLGGFIYGIGIFRSYHLVKKDLDGQLLQLILWSISVNIRWFVELINLARYFIQGPKVPRLLVRLFWGC